MSAARFAPKPAPFAVGTKVRYVGSTETYQGNYGSCDESFRLQWPGMVVEIVEAVDGTVGLNNAPLPWSCAWVDRSGRKRVIGPTVRQFWRKV